MVFSENPACSNPHPWTGQVTRVASDCNSARCGHKSLLHARNPLNRAKDKAKDVLCLNNLKQIGIAFKIYAEENKDKIPRGSDNTTRKFWQQLFLPYIEGHYASDTEFWKVGVFNCPAYPDREQIRDYLIHPYKPRSDARSTSVPGGQESALYSYLSRAVSPSQYIYITDYEDPYENKLDPFEKDWLFILKATDTWADKSNSMMFYDVWAPTHLPYYDPPNRGSISDSFRAARARHRKEGANNLFLDSHAEWLHYSQSVPERWNVKGWEE